MPDLGETSWAGGFFLVLVIILRREKVLRISLFCYSVTGFISGSQMPKPAHPDALSIDTESCQCLLPLLRLITEHDAVESLPDKAPRGEFFLH